MKIALGLGAALLGGLPPVHADPATVASNANVLITTAAAQTSPNALASGYSPSQTLILSNAEKWTNLPGTPPNDGARIGPVMGGGSVSYGTYQLSSVVSSGQSVSPQQAALNTAAASTSAAGATELNEVRYADSVLSASGGGTQYNYSDYRVDVLNNASGTVSASTPFMIKFAGHHLAYAFTYNFPRFNGTQAYVSASPMFLGLEPPDYHSTGTDNQGSTSATASNAFIVGTNSSTAGTFLAMYPGTSGTTLATVTAGNAAATLPARTNVAATAVSGATGASYTIPTTAAFDNGFYFCKVTNASGTTNSNTVALTIALNSNGNLYQNATTTGTSPAPVITTQPSSATVTTGSSVSFTVVATGATGYQWYKIATTHRAAMEAQRAGAQNLATAVQADSALKSSALLSGTFSDIVQGVAGMSGDTGFPATYPTGTTGRGVLFSSLTAAQQATLKPLIKGLIESYVLNASADSSAVLLADYESDAAISATYVGYANGTGAADSTGVTRANFDATVNQERTPQNSQHSYIRIDGPRCWVEFVVQNAVLYSSNGFVHYHSIYRDKLSDYGGEFGGFLNGAATNTGYTGTNYTRPAFTTQPTSVTGSSATFTAAATANVANAAVTPAYQWYGGTAGSGTAIAGATGAAYTTSTAGSYYVTATTAYGTATSNTVTFTVAGSAPSVTSQPGSVSVILGNSATFTVAASGTGTLSYQWYKSNVGSGTAIPGATGATYTIASTTTASAGTYYCVVTNNFGAATSGAATLTLTEPLANYLSSYGLSSYADDSDGDGTSNLLEFVLGGNPTAAGTSILPTVTYTTTGSTPALVFAFYSASNLGSVTVGVQSSNDLATWTTAVSGTNGVTITTVASNATTNYTTVTIPNASSSAPLFARLVATVPGGYVGTYAKTGGNNGVARDRVYATKAVR